jgi:hypothetical protein
MVMEIDSRGIIRINMLMLIFVLFNILMTMRTFGNKPAIVLFGVGFLCVIAFNVLWFCDGRQRKI